jgi:hypothetical protein
MNSDFSAHYDGVRLTRRTGPLNLFLGPGSFGRRTQHTGTIRAPGEPTPMEHLAPRGRTPPGERAGWTGNCREEPGRARRPGGESAGLPGDGPEGPAPGAAKAQMAGRAAPGRAKRTGTLDAKTQKTHLFRSCQGLKIDLANQADSVRLVRRTPSYCARNRYSYRHARLVNGMR